MPWRYNSPPNWPAPPAGWTPPQGWTPDPSWPHAPKGWQFWVDDQSGEPPTATAAAPAGAAPAGAAPAGAAVPVGAQGRPMAPPPPGASRPPAQRGWIARHVAAAVAIGLAAVLLVAGAVGFGIYALVSSSSPTGAASAPVVPAPSPSDPASSDPASPAAPSASPSGSGSATASPPSASTSGKQVTYTGKGNTILSIRKPGSGPALVSATFKGADAYSYFQLVALDSQLKLTQDVAHADATYSGTTLLDGRSGQDTKRLKITGDGRWTVTVKPLSAARRISGSAKGHGNEVLFYDGKPAVGTMSHDGKHNFIVEDFGGAYPQLLANAIGRYQGQAVVPKGPGYVAIEADGNWTLAIH